jgi:hypothetical protein
MGTIERKQKGGKPAVVEEDLRKELKKDPLEERRNTRYHILRSKNFRNVDSAVRCVDSKEEAVDGSAGASQTPIDRSCELFLGSLTLLEKWTVSPKQRMWFVRVMKAETPLLGGQSVLNS